MTDEIIMGLDDDSFDSDESLEMGLDDDDFEDLSDFTTYPAKIFLDSKTDWVDIRKCLVIDTETYKLNSMVRCIQAYDVTSDEVHFFVHGSVLEPTRIEDDLKNYGISVNWHCFEEEKDMIVEFFNLIKENPKNLAGHNITHFDLGLLQAKKKEHGVTGINLVAQTVGSGIGQARQCLTYEVKKDDEKEDFLVIDTMRIAFTLFLPSSLAKLSENSKSNFPKKSVHYGEFEHEELTYDAVIYSIYDVLSIPDVYEYLTGIIYDVSQRILVERKPTSRCIEHAWMKGSGTIANSFLNKLIDSDKPVPDFLTKYFGGLTRVWTNDLIQETDEEVIRYLDLTSAYPWSILKQGILDILNGDCDAVQWKRGVYCPHCNNPVSYTALKCHSKECMKKNDNKPRLIPTRNYDNQPVPHYDDLIYSSTIVLQAKKFVRVLWEIERHKGKPGEKGKGTKEKPLYGLGFVRSYNDEDRIPDYEHSFALVEMEPGDAIPITKAEWEMTKAIEPGIEKDVEIVEVIDGLFATSRKKSEEYIEVYFERKKLQDQENLAELGFKVVINAVYGKLAETKGEWCSICLAGATTSFVRYQILMMVLKGLSLGLLPLYTDTDSMYVFGFPELIEELIKYADELNPEPSKHNVQNLKDEEEDIKAFKAWKRKRYQKFIEVYECPNCKAEVSNKWKPCKKCKCELDPEMEGEIIAKVTGKNGNRDVAWRDILYRTSCMCGGATKLEDMKRRIANCDFNFRKPRTNFDPQPKLKTFVELSASEKKKLKEWFHKQLTRKKKPRILHPKYKDVSVDGLFDRTINFELDFDENKILLEELLIHPATLDLYDEIGVKKDNDDDDRSTSEKGKSRALLKNNPNLLEKLHKKIVELWGPEADRVKDSVDLNNEYGENLRDLKKKFPVYKKSEEEITKNVKNKAKMGLNTSDVELEKFERLCYEVHRDFRGQDISNILPVKTKATITRTVNVHFKNKTNYPNGTLYYQYKQAWKKKTGKQPYVGCFFDIARMEKMEFAEPTSSRFPNWSLDYEIYNTTKDKVPTLPAKKIWKILMGEIRIDTIRLFTQNEIDIFQYETNARSIISSQVLFKFPHRSYVKSFEKKGSDLTIPIHIPEDFRDEIAHFQKEGVLSEKTRFLAKERDVYPNCNLFYKARFQFYAAARINKVRMWFKEQGYRPNIFSLYRFVIDIGNYLQCVIKHMLRTSNPKQKIDISRLPRFTFISNIDIEDEVDEKFADLMHDKSWKLKKKTVNNYLKKLQEAERITTQLKFHEKVEESLENIKKTNANQKTIKTIWKLKKRPEKTIEVIDILKDEQELDEKQLEILDGLKNEAILLEKPMESIRNLRNEATKIRRSSYHYKSSDLWQEISITKYCSLSVYHKIDSVYRKLEIKYGELGQMTEWEREYFLWEKREETYRSEITFKLKRSLFETMTYVIILNVIKHDGFKKYIEDGNLKYSNGSHSILFDGKIECKAKYGMFRAELFFVYKDFVGQKELFEKIRYQLLGIQYQDTAEGSFKISDIFFDESNSNNENIEMRHSIEEKNSAKSEKKFATATECNYSQAAVGGTSTPLEGRGLLRQRQPPPFYVNKFKMELDLGIVWEWKEFECLSDDDVDDDNRRTFDKW